MTEPDLIAIEGTIMDARSQVTNRGDMLLEVVLDQAYEFQGQTFHEYYPIVYWNESIPKEARRGMRVRVLCRVVGRMSRNNGNCYANLRGVSLLALPDDPRPAA